MRLEVLDEEWTPPRLLFREDKVARLRELVRPGSVVVVVGLSGVGKSTLVRKALPGAAVVDCSVKRSYPSIVRELAGRLGVRARSVAVAAEEILEVEGKVVVLDDYTLAHRSRRLLRLVEGLGERHALALVGHPSIAGELEGLADAFVRMPPYSPRELYGILEDRALAGELPVSEEALWAIAGRVGYPGGSGSARLAIAALKEALKLAGGGEAGGEHAEAALARLSLLL